MDIGDLGKWLVAAGIGIAVLGGILWLLGRLPFAGRLPGDINVQVGGVSCFAPLATMLLLSLILTIVLNVLLRLFQK
ncbi:MAG TPA: DUF2905 domain-containing protein [Chloroflexia bacterium]|nr:DUF2905 domain-containing protein [Chloroflexia bacterium]